MAAIPSLSDNALERICACIADTYGGLTGREIGILLNKCGIDDPEPSKTKRYRLGDALSARQRRDGCANKVLAFIQTAMDPVRFVGNKPQFEGLRGELNEVLSLVGYILREDGKIAPAPRARTLTEAEERVDRLRSRLRERNVHADVLVACRAELVKDNYFHAVLEACKSLAEKVRKRTGLLLDGCELVDAAFGLKAPLLAFNSLQTETERGEHTGLTNFMKGVFLTFRNPTAHAMKIAWKVDEEDALDLLTTVSLLHRRVDKAFSTRPSVAAGTVGPTVGVTP